MVQYLRDTQILAHSPEDVWRIQRHFGIGSPTETRRLIHRARQIVNEGHTVPVSREDRLAMRHHILASPRPFNVQRLREELQEMYPSISRRQFSQIIANACRSIEVKERITAEVREQITQYVSESPHSDVARLCDELQESLGESIPRRAILTVVRSMKHRHSVANIPRDQRRRIRDYVISSPRPFNPEHIRDELHQQFAHLSREQLYDQVVRCCVSVELKEIVTPDVRQQIQQHVSNSKHTDNIPLLSDELQRSLNLDIMRLTLHWVVQSAVRQQTKNRSITREERRKIMECVKRSPRPLNPEQIRDVLEEQFAHLSRYQLYELVAKCCSSVELKEMITPDVRQTIAQHVAASDHPDNVPMLCDELQDIVGQHITRRALHKVVRNAVVQQNKKNKISSMERDYIREYVVHSPRPLDPDRLRDELREKYPHLSQYQLYHLVNDCCVSLELKEMVTPELRQQIEQHVAESDHPGDVALLCDELQEKFGLDISRRTLYKIVRGVVQKRKTRLQEEN